MKLSMHGWEGLRPSAMFFVAAVVAAGVMLWTAGQQAVSARRALELENESLNRAQRAYDAAVRERATIVKYFPLYRQLVQRGLAGAEQRMEWVGELHDIGRQSHLLGVNYDIGPQQIINTTPGSNSSNFLLRRSVMNIKLSMLHEVDLLSMLNALHASRHAALMTRRCDIWPVDGAAKSKLTPQLTANCKIDWLTITEPGNPGAQP